MEYEKIIKLAKDGLSIKVISDELKITYAQARYLLKKYKVKTKGITTIYNWEKEFILSKIEKSECKSDLLRNMGIPIRSGNFQTLDRYCKLYCIDISHLRYKNNRGNKFKKIEDEFVFIENSTFTSSFKLKNRAINSGYLENICYKCGNNGTWCGEVLSLQIDHINGINNDHRLINLRIICPNCHSQTLTFRGRKNRIIKKK